MWRRGQAVQESNGYRLEPFPFLCNWQIISNCWSQLNMFETLFLGKTIWNWNYFQSCTKPIKYTAFSWGFPLNVVSFQRCPQDRELSHTTVRVSSATDWPVTMSLETDQSLATPPQVKAFPQESARRWPPEGVVLSSLELLLVLEALVSNTCTALKQFSPRALSLKTAALPALIFAERAGKLIVLSVSPCCTYLCHSEASGKSPYSSVILKMMQSSTRSRTIQMISSAPFNLRAGTRYSQLHLPCHTVLLTLCKQLFTSVMDGRAVQDTLHQMAGRVCLLGSWAGGMPSSCNHFQAWCCRWPCWVGCEWKTRNEK